MRLSPIITGCEVTDDGNGSKYNQSLKRVLVHSANISTSLVDRRTLLAGAGIALTSSVVGCLGGDGASGDNGSADDDDTPSDESIAMNLSLTSEDDDLGSLAFEIEMIDEQFTETQFPTLTIAVTNTGDESVTWGYGGSVQDLPVPQGVLSTPSGLVIGRNGNVEAQLVDTDEGCARVEYFAKDGGIVDVTVEPNETIEETYGISGIESGLDDMCPSPDTYRFEHDYGDQGEWGFEVTVE